MKKPSESTCCIAQVDIVEKLRRRAPSHRAYADDLLDQEAAATINSLSAQVERLGAEVGSLQRQHNIMVRALRRMQTINATCLKEVDTDIPEEPI